MKNLLDHFIRRTRDSRGRPKWRIDIRDAAGRRHRDAFFDRNKARDAVARHLSARENSRAGTPPEAQNIPLAELRDKYLANLRAEKRANAYIANMSACIGEGLAALSAVRLRDITRAKLETWKLYLLKPSPSGKKRANRTVNIKLKALLQMLNYGVSRGFVERNPVARFKLLPDKSESSRLPDNLTVEEVRRLLDVIVDADFRDIVVVALETGMRRGEILHLEFSDLEFGKSSGLIRLRAKSVGGVEWRPKWGKARNIPMSDVARHILRARRVRLKSGLVFPGASGGLRNASAVYHRLKRALKAAGIESWQAYNFHTLRHTFISHQMQAGILSPQEIATVAGQSFRVLKLYSHVRADEVKNLKIVTPYRHGKGTIRRTSLNPASHK